MKRLITLILSLSLAFPNYLLAAAWTSQRNGNWSEVSSSAASPWYDGGTQTALNSVPAVGDSVTTAHTVTVDSNASVGTYPANVTTFDLTVTGKLIIPTGITFTMHGNSYFNHGTSKATAGVGLEMAADSQFIVTNTNRAGQAYYTKLGQYNIVYARGTAGHNAVMLGAAGQTGHYLKGLNDATNSSFDADYFTINNFTGGFTSAVTDSTNAFGTSFKHTTWDGNGTLKIIGEYDNIAPILIEDSFGKNSTALSSSKFQVVGKKGHATNLVMRRNAFNDQVTFSPPTSWTVDNNYFGGNILTAVSSPSTKTSETFASFQNNLVRGVKNSLETRFDNSYLLNDVSDVNGGIVDPYISTGNAYIYDSILELSFGTSNGDMIGPEGLAGTGPFTFEAKRNIFLPNKTGGSPGKFVSFWKYTGTIDTIVENNTVITTRPYSLNPETGIVGFGEYNATCVDDTACGFRSGMVSSLKNNIAWSPSGLYAEGSASYPQGGFRAVRWNSAIQDFVYPADADYNWGWNLSTGQVAGYFPYTSSPTFFSSGTPEANTVLNQDPQFTDTQRNFALYHSKGLGNTPTAWAESSYVIGDTVSLQDSSLFWNLPISYRCIKVHTAVTGDATNGKPGVATNWRTNWEFATHQVLRDDVTQIIDLISWIKDGYRPLNAATATSGAAGTYVGAVEYIAADDYHPAASLMGY